MKPILHLTNDAIQAIGLLRQVHILLTNRRDEMFELLRQSSGFFSLRNISIMRNRIYNRLRLSGGFVEDWRNRVDSSCAYK